MHQQGRQGHRQHRRLRQVPGMGSRPARHRLGLLGNLDGVEPDGGRGAWLQGEQPQVPVLGRRIPGPRMRRWRQALQAVALVRSPTAAFAPLQQEANWPQPRWVRFASCWTHPRPCRARRRGRFFQDPIAFLLLTEQRHWWRIGSIQRRSTVIMRYGGILAVLGAFALLTCSGSPLVGERWGAMAFADGDKAPAKSRYKRGARVKGFLLYRGGYYSYVDADVINVYGGSRAKYGSTNTYRDFM